MALNTEFTHRAHPKVMVSIGNDPDGNHHFIWLTIYDDPDGFYMILSSHVGLLVLESRSWGTKQCAAMGWRFRWQSRVSSSENQVRRAQQQWAHLTHPFHTFFFGGLNQKIHHHFICKQNHVRPCQTMTGWWFGTRLLFFHNIYIYLYIWDVILPIDFHSYFSICFFNHQADDNCSMIQWNMIISFPDIHGV